MEISAKKLKGFKIYNHEANKPFGVVTDICFDESLSKIIALTSETISIIPITKTVSFDSINNIGKDYIVLKKDAEIQSKNSLNNQQSQINFNEIKKAIDPKSHFKKVRDIRFDFETGKMTDIVVSENIFTKQINICRRNVSVKNNTIYINK